MTNWFFYLINTKIFTNFTVGVFGHNPKYFVQYNTMFYKVYSLSPTCLFWGGRPKGYCNRGLRVSVREVWRAADRGRWLLRLMKRYIVFPVNGRRVVTPHTSTANEQITPSIVVYAVLQVAQLSQRGRAMLRVVKNFAKSLQIVQVHSKLHRWVWRVLSPITVAYSTEVLTVVRVMIATYKK